MILLSVYDRKVGAFGNPFCAVTIAEGLRMVRDAIAYGDTILAKHPEDFDIYEVCYFDQNSGCVTEHGKPSFVSAVVPLVEKNPEYEVGDDA